LTYALYKYKPIETFEHQTNLDRWDQSDADVSTFLLDDDAWIGNNSCKYTHAANTNAGRIIRYLEKEEDLFTNWTYLFTCFKSDTALAHSGSEGFGISDDGGTTVDWWFPDCVAANTWYFDKGTLASPDTASGAGDNELRSVDSIIYENNNNASTIYLDFACVAELEIAFNDSTKKVGSPIQISYNQDTAEIKSQNSGGAVVHLSHDTKQLTLNLLLRDTSHWTHLCKLMEMKNKGTPYLLETDMWILPVVIKSIDFSDVARSITVNVEGNYYYVSMKLEEYLGD